MIHMTVCVFVYMELDDDNLFICFIDSAYASASQLHGCELTCVQVAHITVTVVKSIVIAS